MDKYSAIQFKTPAEIKAYQEFRLAGELEYLNNHSVFYQRMFREEGIDISHIRSRQKQTCNCIMTILFV